MPDEMTKGTTKKGYTPTPEEDFDSNNASQKNTPAPRRKKTRKGQQMADADTGSNDPTKGKR